MLSGRRDLQVGFPVDAGRELASMVQVFIVAKWANKELIRDAVGVPAASLVEELPVPSLSKARRENPAWAKLLDHYRTILVHLVHKALGDRLVLHDGECTPIPMESPAWT